MSPGERGVCGGGGGLGVCGGVFQGQGGSWNDPMSVLRAKWWHMWEKVQAG